MQFYEQCRPAWTPMIRGRSTHGRVRVRKAVSMRVRTRVSRERIAESRGLPRQRSQFCAVPASYRPRAENTAAGRGWKTGDGRRPRGFDGMIARPRPARSPRQRLLEWGGDRGDPPLAHAPRSAPDPSPVRLVSPHRLGYVPASWRTLPNKRRLPRKPPCTNSGCGSF